VAFENVRRPEAGARLKAQPLGNVPLVHFVAIGVLQNLQEEIDLWAPLKTPPARPIKFGPSQAE
jgi:hypothetical protein